MGDNTERRIAVCKSGVARIYNMLQYSSTEWESYLSLAQSITASLDRTPFMESQDRAEDQVWMIEGLQRLAYHDADSGGVQSLADWCQRQWLRILEHDPSRSKVLEGLGHSWLLKAQIHLSFIHREDGSPSSGGSDGRTSDGRSINGMTSFMCLAYNQCDDDADAARAAVEAEARLSTPHYVEARATLVPAADMLTAAVRAADQEGLPSGDLLCLSAEAYMSLGNVSSPRVAEEHFVRALRYLRRASEVPDYMLAPYLQRYLDDYERLIT